MLFVSLGIKSIVWIFLLCHCYVINVTKIGFVVLYSISIYVLHHTKLLKMSEKMSFGFLNHAYLQIRDEIVKTSCR